MKKKILVIGGSGFLGRNICKYLSNYEYEVFNFNHGISKTDENEDVKFINGDFFNMQDLKEALKGMDCIIHSISTINPGNSNELYLKGYENEFIQTIKLCDMLKQSGQKMLFISSGGTVYGNHQHQPIDEKELPCPINHYGNVKLCMENSIRTFNYQAGTKFIIARVSNPYGPGQDFHKGVGFIDVALKKTIRGIPIEIWGDGENIRDYIYIEDVCRMIMELVEYDGKEDTFNVSSGIGKSQNDVIRRLEELKLKPEVVYKDKRSVDVKNIVLDNRKILRLSDQQLMNFEKGIETYYNYLKYIM